MPLKVRTAHGGPFRRCNLQFGPDWTIVDDETLNERFGTPEATAKSPTIREILRNEKMLVCEVVKAKPAKKSDDKEPPNPNTGNGGTSKDDEGKGENPKK